MRWKALLFLVTIVPLALLCVGCALHGGPRLVETAETGSDLVWPAPPATTRFAWAGQYQGRRETYRRPHGLGSAADGTLCISDPGNRLVWLHEPKGKVRRIGGEDLLSPVDCALLEDGTLVVADSAAAAVRAFDRRGRRLWTTREGVFRRPTGMAVDPTNGSLLVADALLHQVIRLGGKGEILGEIGSRGVEPGQLNFPTDVAVGREGTIYVVDAMNFRVQVFNPAGEPVRQIGEAGDGPGTFQRPRGVGVDGEGHVYVSDAIFDNVQVFDWTGELLMALGSTGRGPGEFWMPAGVEVDQRNRLLVSDAYNGRVEVFRVLAGGSDRP